MGSVLSNSKEKYLYKENIKCWQLHTVLTSLLFRCVSKKRKWLNCSMHFRKKFILFVDIETCLPDTIVIVSSIIVSVINVN